MRHQVSHAVDRGNLLPGRANQPVHAAEPARQQLGRLLPDIFDAEGEHQPAQIVGLGFFERSDQIGRAFLSHAVECSDLLRLQIIKVRRRVYQIMLYQRLYHGRPQSLDVHRVARGEMDQIAQQLRWAVGVDADHSGRVLLAHRVGTARRADRRDAVDLAAAVLHHRAHLGDDLPRLAHQDGIAHSDPLFVDKILVVQRRAADGGACQRDRFKQRGWGEYTGAADVDFDGEQLGRFLFRRIFERDRPFGVFCGGAEQFPLGKIVHLDYRTVDLISVAIPVLPDLADAGDHIADLAVTLVTGDHMKSQ